MQHRRKRVLLFATIIVAITGAGCVGAYLVRFLTSENHQSRAATESETAEARRAARVSSEQALHGTSSESGRKRYLSRGLSLRTQKDIDRLLGAFPDISDITALQLEHIRWLESIPDELLKQISLQGENLDSLSLATFHISPGETAPKISDAGMAYISRIQNLETLCLACRCSSNGLAYLSRLPKLKTLGLDYPSVNARELFEAVSKIPKIQSLGIRYADFSQPIDVATYRAIASLNGRLKSLDFGEWGETTIHPSMIPAIAEIKSLTWLELGNFIAADDALDPIRKNLLNLRHFGPGGSAAGVRINPDPPR